MMRFTHSSGQHLQVGDASLYFEQVGDPGGKPLVLLHGGLGSLTDFNVILEKLPKQFRLIGIDFRGHGKSTLGSARLTYQQHELDVQQVLDQLGIRSCSVLGFSDGGIVGYRIAARTASRVEALVTVGAQWRLDVNDPVFEMLSGLTSDKWIEMFPQSVDYYRATNPAPNFDALVQAVVGLWTDKTATGYPGSDVAKITAPALIVRGDSDHLMPLHEAAKLRDQIEGAHFFNVPFSGHEAHKDAPELFLAAVNDFLAQPRKLEREA